MASIKSAPRSALTTFAPDAPYMAAGTVAGAVDLSFSSSAHLEIFRLDFQSDGSDLPLAGACPSNERFHRLSWSKPGSGSTENYSLGLIAGGHGDGTISVWNPLKLISSDQEGVVVASLERHTGSVRGLEFNSLAPNLLLSGADGGEICIWDLENPAEPVMFPPLKSVGSGAQTEISFVSWNPKFQPILASTSHNGMTVVWDLRQQKPVTSFSDSHRRSCSVLQWNPDISTQLIIASDDDSSPSLRVWDVRKTISPLREFVGHTKGVIAMSWCSDDSSQLLTCAKDNRTICWDPTHGEMVCELPPGSNSNFDAHWYPKIPGVISASSFDVKIGIYNIQACDRLAYGDLGAPGRSKAPKWLKCPTGASFGFGGKLVSFQPGASTPGAPPSSEVYVHDLVTEHDLVSRSTEFEASIQNGEKTLLRALCDKKSEVSTTEYDRETWAFLKVMFEEEGTARTKLLAHLGFNAPSDASDNGHDELGKKLTNSLNFDDDTNRDALLDGEASAFPIDNGDDFFNNLQTSEDNIVAEDSSVHNGNQIQKEPEVHLETSDPSIDDSIQRALVVGDYKGAVLQCISANRMADALVIAHAGSPSLWETTRNQYLKSSLSPYLKVVSALVSKDLVTLVSSRPLSSWKETLALLCTFAQKEEWTVLCDTLASRLLTVGNTLAATFCYICAGNIDKTVEIWSHGLKSDHEGRSYVDLLQDLMEKTIVLALATGHKRFSASLSKLVENYAELLASQGLLTTAMEYLKLLESEEPSHELAILRHRIALSADIAERESSKSLPYQSGLPPADAVYAGDKSSYTGVDNSQSYYQDISQVQPQPPQQSISTGAYNEVYQHPVSYGGYQQLQPKQQFPEYNPVSFQPPPTQMFVPTHTAQIPQPSFTPPPVSEQPTVSFVPSTPPPLRNVGQYHQTSLGSQLYSGVNSQTYGPPGSALPRVGGPQVGTGSGHMFPPPAAHTPVPGSFMPVTNPGLTQRPGTGPVQPPSPTQSMHVQPHAAAPAAPPPTVQTVNTSNVPAELRPVISTLTRLFHETSEILGGARANVTKKREIEDNSRKIGALFAKLNNGDISPNAASKLRELCQALDNGDFASALHIQVMLTTSDWDECNFWLATLKRMIKSRQNVRVN